VAAPYQQSGADVALAVLLGLFALGELVTRVRSFRNRSGMPYERWSLLVVVLGVAGGVIAGFGLAGWQPAAITTGEWPLFILGLVFMAAGIAIRQWAVFTLGRFFTVDVRLHPDQVVVSHGPYRWVRHPSYTGMLVFFIGLGLALTNWASLAALFLLPALGLVIRIHSEERALFTGLGQSYRDFALTRRRLFPGVW
jgi:protein-S-isoprenylcysteine O-methyltransferase Ste14